VEEPVIDPVEELVIVEELPTVEPEEVPIDEPVAVPIIVEDIPVEAQVCDDSGLYPDFALAVRDWGDNFCFQAYQTQTADGYNLTLFRLLAPPETVCPEPKSPLLLMHGFSTDSITWWNMSDSDELGVGAQLALECYDVYFSNYRGTKNSRTHATLSPDSSAFWDFDFVDIAEMDVPAIVEKIVEVNGNCKKVTVVAHSQGAQNILVSLASSTRATEYIA
jgi:pimeloyl-ACP methyl ester carboxylesterase